MIDLAVIGDVGGHSALLAAMIRDLGGDPELGTLPETTVVVQVGDLITQDKNRGPDSDGCVAIADRMLRCSNRNWLQLWGNHDMAAIGGPRRPAWGAQRRIAAETTATLMRWWRDKVALRAVCADFGEHSVLICHAGLTVGSWTDLERPDAMAAARLLNGEAWPSNPNRVRPGMLVTEMTDEHADVSWAEVVHELYEPWHRFGLTEGPIPFSQIHGHASPWNWNTDEFWPGTPDWMKQACSVNAINRTTLTSLGRLADGADALAQSVDWSLLESAPQMPWPVTSFRIHSLGT